MSQLITVLVVGLLASILAAEPVFAARTEQAVLAGGCFWCLEHDLEKLAGVLDVESGYSGGRTARPTYQQVSAGGTGHQESVQVRFDPDRISYAALLRSYWRNIDPVDGAGQFCDRGSSYRPVIFVADALQRRQAQASLTAAARELGRPTEALQVAIRPLDRFWPAERYHQDYARLNAVRYRYYRWACGRDRRLDAIWGARARSGQPWLQGRG
ncbi:MAG: peptide-methionine (S)-S-oxide reductase MsrA [Cyanobium sp.]|nr:peptide-methionine (S)-S-oxide reductase MsrA [Cyanobium sp.]